MRKYIAIEIAICTTIILCLGCTNQGPASIHYGQDLCDYCKMTIADNKFGSQLVTSKGKAFKFDSIECLAAYAQISTEEKASVNSMWVTDFKDPETFVRVDSATIILSEQQNSPMGVGLVAISSSSQAESFIKEMGGRILNWAETCELVAEVWKL